MYQAQTTPYSAVQAKQSTIGQSWFPVSRARTAVALVALDLARRRRPTQLLSKSLEAFRNLRPHRKFAEAPTTGYHPWRVGFAFRW